MCGRYTMTTAADVLRGLFALEEIPSDPSPRWNVAPTQAAPVVPNLAPRALREFRWGLVPSWAKDPSIGNRMINARAETVAEKPSFRTALRKRRCVVPATGFYEWRREGTGKTPFLFRARDGSTLALAGLWETWRSPDGEVRDTFTIVTTTPNPLLAAFHDRMPVVLDGEGVEAWLDVAPAEPASLLPLLRPCPAVRMEAVPVATRVNNPRHDDAACAAPTGSPVRVEE